MNLCCEIASYISNMFRRVGNTQHTQHTQHTHICGKGDSGQGMKKGRWMGEWVLGGEVGGEMNLCLDAYAMMNGLQMRDICKQIYSNIHLFECVWFFSLILSITTGIMDGYTCSFFHSHSFSLSHFYLFIRFRGSEEETIIY